jgi:hypothetical protein
MTLLDTRFNAGVARSGERTRERVYGRVHALVEQSAEPTCGGLRVGIQYLVEHAADPTRLTPANEVNDCAAGLGQSSVEPGRCRIRIPAAFI